MPKEQADTNQAPHPLAESAAAGKTDDPAVPDPRHVRQLVKRMRESLLPSDSGFAGTELNAAASFVAASMALRPRAGDAIAVESVVAPGGERFLRLAIINADMPFLVDSVAATVDAAGLVIERLVHPVLPVARDGGGRLVALPGGEAPTVPRESIIYIETPRANARARKALASALAITLADVRAAVADWKPMQAAMRRDAERLDQFHAGEQAELLRWFADDRMTLLGHVTRQRDGSQHGALGICRASTGTLLPAAAFDHAFARFDAMLATGPGAIRPLIVKSDRLGRVHRRVPLDLVLTPILQQGAIGAISVHAGMWTSAALAASPGQVPDLRTRLAMLLAKYRFNPSGHTGKALAHALSSLPHDLMIGLDPADVERLSLTVMSLVDRPRPRLALVRPPLGTQLLVFVWLPRDAMATALRQRIADMVATAAAAPVLDWSLEIHGSNVAQLLFVLDLASAGPTATVPDEPALDRQLQGMVRGWADAVEAEIARDHTPMRAAAIAGRYADAFPESYRAAYGPAEAAIDIARLRRLPAPDIGASPRSARLYRLHGDGPDRLRLKIYHRGEQLRLSDTVPWLENFGFRVIDAIPTELNAREEPLGAIHDMLLTLTDGVWPGAVLRNVQPLEDALTAVLNGEGEDDAFNRLITTVGLSTNEAGWLRAWYRYLRQVGMSFGIPTAVDALSQASDVTLALVDLFRARHQPGLGERRLQEAMAEQTFQAGLARVTAINDDRLLRAFRAVVLAILRTNAFTPAGAEALAFKLDPTRIPGLPTPLPWREIFVYSARVEGVHLRCGPVARGGLRWSDRRDDYRTEVLGLMKAQRVKNAVIVPTGAKGGFYPKRLPDPLLNRDAWAAEGRASYQVFIRALLSITDTIRQGELVHPVQVIVRDDADDEDDAQGAGGKGPRGDPYFVVAADKGTASFSDTANAIALAQDFWLGDAFASGGSHGYDHKAMGITARGAWLSVRRHFLEMGVDVQSQPVRVAGVGDMSGDVFGNGMLLSSALKLVAAFDHRHIFLDPDPEPAAAWAERDRLFRLPRSSWADYDPALISPGGGVFARSQKQIPLSPEVRALLDVEDASLDPDALIRAILKAPVDLLWFGGIGTYVKATGQRQADVGDPANDAVRVDGARVRARVIGEGANLGCTQAGRIDYALAGADGAGGRVNTDFIDNSAGVDCSDKEVNIKIALAAARADGRLDEQGREALLGAMTHGVADLVLEDNRLQALALSVAEAGGAEATPALLRLIEQLEESGQLDRAGEGLAADEALNRRATDPLAPRGLTRPELAVLLSSAKLAAQDALEASAVPDDPDLEDELLQAFPEVMRRTFAADIGAHRLRREILSTRVANRLINRLGFIHPFELAEEEGVGLAEVAAAFLAAEALFDMPRLWHAIEATAMPESARIALFATAARGLRLHMADLLRLGGAGGMAPLALASRLAWGIADLATAQIQLSDEIRAQSARLRAELAGAPAELVGRIVHLFDQDGAVGLAALAREQTGLPAPLARAFVVLGSRLGLDWAQAAANRLSPADPWEALLVAGLARDFQQMRLDFLRRHGPFDSDPTEATEHWLAARQADVDQFRARIAQARRAPTVSAAMLARLAGMARNLLSR